MNDDSIVPAGRVVEGDVPAYVAEVRRDSLGELLRRLLDDVVYLVRSEFQLARSEMRDSVASAMGGLGALAAGGAVMIIAGFCLVGGIVALLATSVGIVAASFIVAAVATVIGALLILFGINRLKQVDFAPGRTVSSLKRSAEALKGDD